MRILRSGEHLQCLDVLKLTFPPGVDGVSHDCAILLEIWESGALFQTSVPILVGSMVFIASIRDGIPAKVLSCEQDSYGFLLEVAIDEPAWFPEGYMPPHILRPEQNLHS